MKWIKHEGNEMPVSGDTLVFVKLQNGCESKYSLAASCRTWTSDMGELTIIEYAIEKSEDQKDQEPQKTLRDEFAMAALTGLLNAYAHRYVHEDSVKEAYLIADMMMKERTK